MRGGNKIVFNAGLNLAQNEGRAREKKTFKNCGKSFWQIEKSYYLCRPEREKRSGREGRKRERKPGNILEHEWSAFGYMNKY